METIVKAKDQQAAEANKNASILLKELDMEKVTLIWQFFNYFINLLRSIGGSTEEQSSSKSS